MSNTAIPHVVTLAAKTQGDTIRSMSFDVTPSDPATSLSVVSARVFWRGENGQVYYQHTLSDGVTIEAGKTVTLARIPTTEDWGQVRKFGDSDDIFGDVEVTFSDGSIETPLRIVQPIHYTGTNND